MADETYEFTRKLRYLSKNEDNWFITKYTIEVDPDNATMHPPKSTQRSSSKMKSETFLSDPDTKKSVPAPEIPKPARYPVQQEPEREPRKQRIDRKSKRARKILELKQEEAEIFKNFNKYNSKRMCIVQDKHKGDRKRKDRKGNKYNDFDKGMESSEDLDNMYEYLISHQPHTKKRLSKSIDNINKSKEKFEKPKEQFLKDKGSKKIIYEPYKDIEDILDSRDENENKYFKGTIEFNERVKNYARIFSKEIEGDLVVEGLNKNRCIHGDQVYFQVLPKSNEKISDKKGQDFMQEKIQCKVVYILPWKKNEKRKIVGKLEFGKSNNTYYLVPINKKIISFDVKFSDISQSNLKKANQKYFLAEFTEWKETDEYPSCKVLSEFGALGEIETETGALLINNGVEDKEYDEETVQKGLQKFLKAADENGQYKISQEEVNKRTDLRNHRIFTIDPLTAKDFDDALSISYLETTQNGESIYQVGVHIADASFFVEEGGLIDERAQLATTSVYLVHRVLPMLPRVLCETMCSLNPGLERLTISIWFKVTSEGEVLPGSRYDRTVIKSKARFTYEQAQNIIQGKAKSQTDIEVGFGCVKSEDFPKVAEDIRIMNSIAMKIRSSRIKGGSLIFETPKKSFKLDQNFYPESFTVAKRFQANFLVEEYMLLANQKVGEVLVEHLKASALLRRHKFPSDKKIEKFQKFTLKINQPIKVQRNMPMQEQMNQVMNNPKIRQCIKEVLNYEMIFLLEQAEYFVVGDTPKDEWLHYALNMGVYTHFTSPIRRYPDIMVHRQMAAIINGRRNNIPKDKIEIPSFKKLKEVVDRCNKNKISAKKVSSGCEKIFLCLYLKTHPVFCKAVLTDMNQYCLFVCVPSYDFRSAIELKELKKVRPLQFDKDSSERKYVEMECQYEKSAVTKIIFKEMQEIDIKLTAKEGFPIDYLLRVVLPHPKNLGQTFTLE